MSKYSRDLESLRQNDNDLMVQYEELLCLRAQLASLLFPLKRSPPRKHIARSNRSPARLVHKSAASFLAEPEAVLPWPTIGEQITEFQI
jgi:hypothetical protein